MRLLFCLLVLLAAGLRAEEPPAPLVDEDYRFRLDPPGGKWKLMDQPEATKLVPDAIAGVLSTLPPLCGVVIAEAAPGADLNSFVDQLIDGMPLEGKRTIVREETEFEGQKAVRYVVEGRMDNMPLRFENLVFANRDHVFQLIGWGHSMWVKEDSFVPFHRAFHVLEGEVRGRSRGRTVVDAHGVGWRLRDGRFESAAFELAIEPEGDWTVAIGIELESMNEDAEVGLIHSGPEVYLVIIPERAVGVDRKEFTEIVLAGGMDETCTPLAGDRTVTVGGREVRMRRQRMSSSPPVEMWKGVLWRGDLCYQVVAWFVAGLEEEAAAVLPQAFSAIRFFSEEETATVARELSAGPDPENAVGDGFGLRRGVYRSFQHTFVWRKPSGYWRLHAGQAARIRNEDATLFFEEPRLGIMGMFIHETAPEFDAESYHRAVLATMFGETQDPEEIPVRPVRLDGVEARRSDVRMNIDGLDFSYRVVTLKRGAEALQVLLYGTPGNMAAAEASLADVLGGLRFPAELLPETAEKGVVVDHRLGWSMGEPGFGWRSSFRTPPAVRPIGTIRQWSDGKGIVQVVAFCALQPGQDADWFRDFIRSILEQAVGSRFFRGEPRRSAATLGGVPAERLVWDAGRRLDVVVAHRDQTFYALMLIAPPGAKETWGKGFVESFRFID